MPKFTLTANRNPFYYILPISFFFFTVLFSNVSFSQRTDSVVTIVDSSITTSDSVYPYSPKPQSQLELGIHAGISLITGDISPNPGFGFGVSLRKAVNNVFSLRSDYTGSLNYGMDYRLKVPNMLASNTAPNPWLTYYNKNNSNSVFLPNYKTVMHQLSLQGIASLNTNSIHRGNPKTNFYTFLGYTLLIANVDVNALGANGQPYNFAPGVSPVDFTASRRSIKKQLKNYMDNTYESNGGVLNGNRTNIGLNNNNQLLRHAVNGGFGFAFKINKKINVALEHKVTYTFIDDLDGIYAGRTNDVLHYTSVRLNINIGKNRASKGGSGHSVTDTISEPLWWINSNKNIAKTTSQIVHTTTTIYRKVLVSDTIVLRSTSTTTLSGLDKYLVYFNFDDSIPRKVSHEELDSVAELLLKDTSLNIEIAAHTDAKGSNEYNERLSLARAQAVKSYLLNYTSPSGNGQHIKASQLESVAFGELVPAAPNTINNEDNKNGRSLNRRAEIKVYRIHGVGKQTEENASEKNMKRQF